MPVSANATVGSEAAAPSLQVFSTRFARRKLLDRTARHVVTLGGLVIIGSILAILLVIAGEAYPLLRPASVRPLGKVEALTDSPILAVDTDESRTAAALVTAAGVSLVSMDGSVTKHALPEIGDARVTSASPPERRPIALGLSDGRVLPVDLEFRASEGQSDVEPRVLPPIVAGAGHAVERVAYASREGAAIAAALLDTGELVVVRITEETSLLGKTTREEARAVVELPGRPSALAVDGRGDQLFVGLRSGELARVDLRSAELHASPATIVASRRGAAVTVLGFVLGDRTLVVGDEAGGVSTWQTLRGVDGEDKLVRIHAFPAHGGPVTTFAASARHKGFWTGDASGALRFDYSTTGQSLVTVHTVLPPAAIRFAPKSDGLVAADGRGLARWDVDCPHPEVSLRALFGKLWYEGYDAPAYVWQSTGGSDDFEAKLSLTPLLYGTLKGTFYALIFAVPIALGGALYASQFMHPRLKAVVKPTVEIMAALPSVVLGFMAGLWLAPNVERVVPGLFLSPAVIACVVLAALASWRRLPGDWRTRLRPGTEVFLLVPLVVAGLWLSFVLGGWIEATLLGGDYRTWLSSVAGIHYDQRNSIVVGLAMGFAVIPVIFTIADDSLSNVPPHLTAGSLALGATRWQTAVRVVLPSASPGIFSAIMIGFGRAVGETMIVLMATGNTPIMSGSAFNGFRALSANVAVELPEAPQGGTLFRVLFVAALLLFAMTFIINTAAEIVRLRLRERYRTL